MQASGEQHKRVGRQRREDIFSRAFLLSAKTMAEKLAPLLDGSGAGALPSILVCHD